ncbi:MAG TPA: glycosyltransferase family 4 protein [Gallicola sp.]|nr:glycosyltransferase family 4 protein [Gallicola sp.]
MKILWFSNTPANGEEYIKYESLGGGWLKSLDKQLQEKVELHIAFYHPHILKPFKYKKTYYYPINSGNFYFNLIKKVFSNKIKDEEDLQIYLSLIKRIKPDLIHIQGTENPFGCIIGKISIPIVVSIQGNITIYEHKYFSGIEKKYFRKLIFPLNRKTLLNGFFPFINKYKMFSKLKEIEQRNLLNCKYIIGRTSWDKRISTIFSPFSEYFYCSEILRDTFYTKEWTPHNREKIIIHSTNANNPYKGFEIICHTINILNGLNINFEWQVAGIKNDDLINKITKKKLNNNYPRKNLKLLGSLTENQLVNSLLYADIYVMTSHIENSPNNLCEAMILGMPCIATFVGGTSSLLKDGEEGILIQEGDPWVTAGAILELIRNRDKAIKYGQNARNKALIRHNKDLILDNLIQIYKTIIEKNERKQ